MSGWPQGAPYGAQPYGNQPQPYGAQGAPHQYGAPQQYGSPQQNPQQQGMPQQYGQPQQGQQYPAQQYGGQQYAPQQYGAPPGWPGPQQPGERVRPGVLIAVSLWRLLVFAFGLIGFLLAINHGGDLASALPALSQQASLFTAIVYFGLLCYPAFTGFRRHEPRSPWLRGATTVLLVLVGGTFLSLLGGALDEGWSLFEHLLTPLVLLIDWFAVGSNQRNCKWWYPLSWIGLPLLYLIYYNAAHLDLYSIPLSFGDPAFFGYLVGFIAGVVVVGYLLFGIGRLRVLVALQQPGYPPQAPWPGQQTQAWQQPQAQQPLTQQPQAQQPQAQQPHTQQPQAQQYPQQPPWPGQPG